LPGDGGDLFVRNEPKEDSDDGGNGGSGEGGVIGSGEDTLFGEGFGSDLQDSTPNPNPSPTPVPTPAPWSWKPTPKPTPAPPGPPVYREVQRGDTLGQLVLEVLRAVGVTAACHLFNGSRDSLVNRVAAFNGLENPDLIAPGRAIAIPVELLTATDVSYHRPTD
jgi:hypothetical protein